MHLEPNLVYINEKPYRARVLQPTLVSQWPGKVVIGGDITRDSHLFLSTWADIQHATGGLGVYKFRAGDDPSRYWTSSAETRYSG